MLNLKRSCSVLAILVALGMPVRVAYAQGAENFAAPSRISLTLEGAPFFVRNDPNLLFSSTDDKLGNLGGVGLNGIGGYGRVALISRLNQTWDLRVSASALATDREEKSRPYKTNETKASTVDQAFRMAFADVEAGTQALSAPGLNLRLSAGIRAFRSETNGEWSSAKADDKVGSFDDKSWGAGPRVGAELTVPLSQQINVITGASLAALYHRDVNRFLYENFPETTLTKTSSSSWSINADALAGISFDLDGGAKFSAGYRAQYWDNILSKRTEMKNDGSFQQKGRSPLLAHGPLVSLTFPIGAK